MKNTKISLATLPIIFLFVTVFVTYTNINFFLLSGLVLVAYSIFQWNRITVKLKGHKTKMAVILPFALILVGSIGLSASATLTREKLELAANPDHITSCSVNPIVACSPVIGSDQASVFAGMPNPVLGLFGFAALFTAGMSLLAGGKFSDWWWKTLWAGCLLGLVFIGWLAYQTLYSIGALCIYCMVVWSSVVPLFYYVTYRNVLNGVFSLPKRVVDVYREYHLLPTAITYGILIAMIYLRFDYYWNTLI